MTTTTDTLTRWLPLFEQDEGLRPMGIMWLEGELRASPHASQGWYFTDGTAIHKSVVRPLIRDSAVRWLLARNHGRSYVHIDSNAGDPLPPIVIRSVGCMNKPGDTLADALYAACKAVLAKEKT